MAGEIDTIATDHCSFNLHGQKDRGRDDFRAIPNGGPGVEHRPVAIATSFEGQLGPEDLCRLMSENPARVFGMYPRKGCLAEGSDADVCVWDPKARWTISAATQHQAVDYTPLEGFEAHGRAKARLRQRRAGRARRRAHRSPTRPLRPPLTGRVPYPLRSCGEIRPV